MHIDTPSSLDIIDIFCKYANFLRMVFLSFQPVLCQKIKKHTNDIVATLKATYVTEYFLEKLR